MMIHNTLKKGFTIIELITVIAILGILATIGVAAYGSIGEDRYDAEAMGHMASIYEQVLNNVQEWGLVSSTSQSGVAIGCYILGPDAGTSYNSADINNFGTAGKTLGLQEKGLTHWRYKVCVGHIVGDAHAEGILVSAHRDIENRQRIIFMGAGIELPIVVCAGTAKGEGDKETCTFSPPVNLSDAEWKIKYFQK